uniref:Uncharacterized protein n=1 Tax=Anguilla anguilla TaxID=7936 RepID=A0A0E9P5Z6_ANGAN
MPNLESSFNFSQGIFSAATVRTQIKSNFIA